MIKPQELLANPLDQAGESQDKSSSRGEARSLSDAQKEARRAQREQAKMAARKAARVTYDLPPNLREDLRLLSEELRIPSSQLAALALIRFLKDFKSGALDLGNYKKPSRSPRYDWNLELPENPMKVKKKVKSLKSLK